MKYVLTLHLIVCTFCIINYVWDNKKNDANILKHGINFSQATNIFEHPTLRRIDDRNSYGEERWIAIGLLAPHSIVVVAYVEKTEDTIRIISARKANKYEQKQYKNNFKI